MEFSEEKPRIKDEDFEIKGAAALNEAELSDVSEKCWGVLRPQVMRLGMAGKGMSASFVLGYIRGFLDGYLQQFSPPCSIDSFYEVWETLNFSYLSEADVLNLSDEQRSNQIVEPNEEFFIALFSGFKDGKLWAVDPRHVPNGLQILYDDGISTAGNRQSSKSISYELGQRVGEAIEATKSLGIFDKLKLDNTSTRLSDDDLFEQAYDELQNDELVKGVWARALSDSGGDEKKAEALYLKLRVQHLKDEKRLTTQKKQAKKKAEQKKKLEEDRIKAEIAFRKDAEAAQLKRLEQEQHQLEMERLEQERFDAMPERSFPIFNILIFILFVALFLFAAHLLIEYGKSL